MQHLTKRKREHIKQIDPTTLRIWPIVGGAALIAVAYVLVKNLGDLRRYIKIERM